MIVHRLAVEIDIALRGKRVRAGGRLGDGRFAVQADQTFLAIDAFGATPLVTLEPELELTPEAGWARAIPAALVGLRIEGVRARRGDRLIAFECAARSRFGVRSAYRLVVELVPRFGNIVLLKDDTVVAAAKEFTRADNARRATVVGEPYEPPPLPDAAGDFEELVSALDQLLREPSSGARERARRGLRMQLPLVPNLVADAVIIELTAAATTTAGAAAAVTTEAEAAAANAGPGATEIESVKSVTPSAIAQQCLARAGAIVDAVCAGRHDETNVFAYREGDRLVQCHVVALAQYAGLEERKESALLPLLHDTVGNAAQQRAERAFQTRRASLAARLAKRRRMLAAERQALERERDDAAGRDALRLAGEALYAHHADVPLGATTFVPPHGWGAAIALDPQLDAKGNAAAIFKRYRKDVAKLAHVKGRLGELALRERIADELVWELERAEPETLDDVAAAAQTLERRKDRSREKVRAGRPIEVGLADDARVYVGRSPRGNADLTFRMARPHDIWFHARATPGAHVVLHIDSGRRPTGTELDRAASLAAFHSKARGSEKVSVDYTERRFVRRQANAPPGLVWYTNARTLLVAPQDGTR